MNICYADQDQRLRDSTDFETQLYLCNEAFKVPSSTLSKLQQNFKIPHIHIHRFHSQLKTLKLKYFTEHVLKNTIKILFSFATNDFDLHSGSTGTPTTDFSPPPPCRRTSSLPSSSSWPSSDPPWKGGGRQHLRLR